MHTFLTRFAGLVTGVLCGFDRLFFRASLRNLIRPYGLQNYLWANRILFKDFGQHSKKVTARLVASSLGLAQQLGREVRYLNCSEVRKDDLAREIAARDGIKSGPICVLRSVDPCMSFQINKNRDTHKLEIRYRQRKCLHLYHYQIHPVFGFMHTRIQTWFPFRIYVCLNGREWLARQMDQARLHYCRRKNTFTWLEDVAQAQALFDQQLQANWSDLLGGLAQAVNPIHDDIFAKFPCRYHWTVADSEWASDVMFRSRAALEEVYPRLVHYAVTTFDAVDVLRFLGKPIPASGKVPHRCRHEVITNLTERLEGTRLKHWLNHNSIKMYDKGSVLRPETTLREPGQFKVYRSAEGDPDGPKDWRPLRKGIADLPRRAEVCQAANERYLEALAAVHDTTPLRQLAEPLCRPTLAPAKSRAAAAAEDGAEAAPPPTPATEAAPAASPARPRIRRVRALNPLAAADAALLKAVSGHEFLTSGLRNRDLRRLLYGAEAGEAAEDRRRSAAVTRQLRLLRAHGLVEKVSRTHRYLVTEHGRQAITALLAARNASTEELIKCAA
ncbi:MAG TPA: hypothetical protein VG099_09255 [Gemmataceae bacterium]|nr:hypothetical protein [Gemmataceae bacterium]